MKSMIDLVVVVVCLFVVVAFAELTQASIDSAESEAQATLDAEYGSSGAYEITTDELNDL